MDYPLLSARSERPGGSRRSPIHHFGAGRPDLPGGVDGRVYRLLRPASFTSGRVRSRQDGRDSGVAGKRHRPQLLQAVVEAARSAGTRRLYLETNHILAPAIRLYHSIGFQPVPSRPYRALPLRAGRCLHGDDSGLTVPSFVRASSICGTLSLALFIFVLGRSTKWRFHKW